jgi:hypothetical protein
MYTRRKAAQASGRANSRRVLIIEVGRQNGHKRKHCYDGLVGRGVAKEIEANGKDAFDCTGHVDAPARGHLAQDDEDDNEQDGGEEHGQLVGSVPTGVLETRLGPKVPVLQFLGGMLLPPLRLPLDNARSEDCSMTVAS